LQQTDCDKGLQQTNCELRLETATREDAVNWCKEAERRNRTRELGAATKTRNPDPKSKSRIKIQNQDPESKFKIKLQSLDEPRYRELECDGAHPNSKGRFKTVQSAK